MEKDYEQSVRTGLLIAWLEILKRPSEASFTNEYKIEFSQNVHQKSEFIEDRNAFTERELSIQYSPAEYHWIAGI